MEDLNATSLYKKLQYIRKNLDKVETIHLSSIKEIIKRINFCDISTKQQSLDNVGNAVYRLTEEDELNIYRNVPIDYTIKAGDYFKEPNIIGVGVSYGLFKESGKDNDSATYTKSDNFNSYTRFISDIVSNRVIFSRDLDCFVCVQKNQFEKIDNTKFLVRYAVDAKKKINDFLEILETIYREHIGAKVYDYTLLPYTIGGKGWMFDVKRLKMIHCSPEPTELLYSYYDVSLDELSQETADSYLKMISSNPATLHNLKLIHAYVMWRKLKLVPAEKFFIFKDFGRTGKGLFVKTLGCFKINNVNFETLTQNGFEEQNEWVNFCDCDIAHANETGEITPKFSRVMRKIATGETVTGRVIGSNSIRIKLQAVLILDTNEKVNLGDITANQSRVVNIKLKDQPEDEKLRKPFFKPYWDFIEPDEEVSIAACLSFLLNSLEYLSENNGDFHFRKVALKNYSKASDLTMTQRELIEKLSEQEFFISKEIEPYRLADYGKGNNTYGADLNAIGIESTVVKIDKKPTRVLKVKNNELFEEAKYLLEL